MSGVFSLKRKPEELAVPQISSPMKKPRVEPVPEPSLMPKPASLPPLPTLPPIRAPNLTDPSAPNKYIIKPVSRIPTDPPVPTHTRYTQTHKLFTDREI